MPIIVNAKPTQRTLADGTILMPGANEVSQETLDRAKQVPHTQALFAKGLLQEKIEVQATKTFQPNHFIPDLAQMKVKEALLAIAACEDPAQLRQWALQDARVKIKDALLARHEELLGPEDKDAPKDFDDTLED